MIRETSIEAYNEIKANGILTKMKFETYRLLFRYGPMTANQLMAKAKLLAPYKTHQSIESLGRRLSELRDQGAVKELGKIVCPISGHKCIQWDVTSRIPVKLEKPQKEKCKACGGKGYLITQQLKFNLKG